MMPGVSNGLFARAWRLAKSDADDCQTENDKTTYHSGLIVLSGGRLYKATTLRPTRCILLRMNRGPMKRSPSGIVLVIGILLGAFGVLLSQQLGVQTQRIPQFENDDVKVWKSIVTPNAPLTMHRHEHGRVIVALAGGAMKIVEQTGPSEQHVWETGKAYWLPANAPNTMHADVNAGDKPIEVMVVELKKDSPAAR
jgi:hypothetical protein